MSNAIKFTSEGSVKVTFKRMKTNVVISVADTGIGIRESDKEIIFDRFRQAEMGLADLMADQVWDWLFQRVLLNFSEVRSGLNPIQIKVLNLLLLFL